MNKGIVFLGGILLLLCSCTADDALLTEVQKVVEIDMQFSNNRVDGQGQAVITRTTDILAEEFSEYLGQTRDFEINRLTIDFHLVDPVSAQPNMLFERLAMDLSSLEAGGPRVDVFDMENISVSTEVLSLVLFRKDRTSSSEVHNAMNFIRSRLLREQPFSWDLEGHATGLSSEGHVEIKLMLDLTAEVVLP